MRHCITGRGIALEKTIVSLIPLNGFDRQKGPAS